MACRQLSEPRKCSLFIYNRESPAQYPGTVNILKLNGFNWQVEALVDVLSLRWPLETRGQIAWALPLVENAEIWPERGDSFYQFSLGCLIRDQQVSGDTLLLGIQKTPQLNPEAMGPRERPLTEGQELAKSPEPLVMRAVVCRLGVWGGCGRKLGSQAAS